MHTNAGLTQICMHVIWWLSSCAPSHASSSRYAPDPIADLITSQGQNSCSCDCCEVTKRLPNEIEIGASGQLLRFKCHRAALQSDRCSLRCFALQVEAGLDYSRYCLQHCAPSVQSSGTSCFPILEDTKRAPHALSGQMATAPGQIAAQPLSPPPQPDQLLGDGARGNRDDDSGGRTASWAKQIQEQKAVALEKAEAASQSKLEQRIVNWDLRRLAAERLRAETGADLAHGAAVGEEIRIHRHIVEQNLAHVREIKEALAHVPTGVGETIAVADTDASKAGDAAKATGILLKGAKASVGPSLAVTRRKALDLIKRKARGLAQQEAAAYAERMDWDKPGDWKRILAMRASAPYAQAVVDAAQRFSQYRAVAKHTLHEAQAFQDDASKLSPRVESMQKHGDIPGAIDMRNQMRTLQERSTLMKNQAHRYWRTSEEAWKSMSEWQSASNAAADYVARVYEAEHTAPAL